MIFRVLLSRLDPERAHALAAVLIRAIGLPPLAALFRRFSLASKTPGVDVLGLTFPTRFGLAAGFDKDARYLAGLAALGFGHVEVGTVTPRPQSGNPRPRLFRLVADRALVNRMGFNNAGAEVVAERIRRMRARSAGNAESMLIGVNIGKNRATDMDLAAEDYRAAAAALAPVADYLVLNVSSPNTPGLRGLQEPSELGPIIESVLGVCGRVPLLVKVAPELSDAELESLVSLTLRLGAAGLVVCNTTVSRAGLATEAARINDIGPGGLSGAPLKPRSLEMLRLIRRVSPPELAIISVGGVATADDVRERVDAGADLVQGYTEFVYSGPLWARRINRELAGSRRAPAPTR